MIHLSFSIFRVYAKKPWYWNPCCGAGGAKIIWGPGAGAEIIFLINIFCSQFEDARMKKS